MYNRMIQMRVRGDHVAIAAWLIMLAVLLHQSALLLGQGPATSQQPREEAGPSEKLLRVLRLLMLAENKTPITINDTGVKALMASAEFWYRVQLLYDRYGGHGLVPLVSLPPGADKYFNPEYTLEVSEYACELPYIYAWLYWLTRNETWLDRVLYSVDAIWYWSIDGKYPLGGCWGVTDPVAYDARLQRYVRRYSLVSWYMQAMAAWRNPSRFAESAAATWRYISWYDERYRWAFYTPWEMVYVDDVDALKRGYMDFVHAWLGNASSMKMPGYAYIYSPGNLTVEGAEKTGSYIYVSAENATVTIEAPGVYLLENHSYSVVMDVSHPGGPVEITAELVSADGKVLSGDGDYYFGSLDRVDEPKRFYVSMGTSYYRGGPREAILRITIKTGSGSNPALYIYRVGLVSVPGIWRHSIVVEHYWWGDSLGPMLLALQYYRPDVFDDALEFTKKVLRELVEWGTDRVFYPPDPRWRFLAWVNGAAEWVGVPRQGDVNYASLEETLVSLVPVAVATGDEELTGLIEEAARMLSHENYWRDMGFWSLWFGVWTHLWLYAVTGDDYFRNEASYYTCVIGEYEKSLDEESSNAAKLIEACYAKTLFGDTSAPGIADEMMKVFLEKFVDPDYGFIRPYSYDQKVARHDILAWDASPIISHYLTINTSTWIRGGIGYASLWVPDWMLWMHPVVYDSPGRPNGFLTPIDIFYYPGLIHIPVQENTPVSYYTGYYVFPYSGILLVDEGIKAVEPTPRSYFPYVSHIVLDDPVAMGPRLIGVEGTTTGIHVKRNVSGSTLTISITNTSETVLIIDLNGYNVSGILINGNPAGPDKYIIYKHYLVIIAENNVKIYYTGSGV